MADELFPPQIRNGGAGAPATSGSSRTLDYRELQAPAQVRTDLPDNGAAARAAALGGLFKEFEGVSSAVHTQFATHAGALAGAAAGATGQPGYKQGLARLTVYGRAFNNAATGAYAVQAEAQADDSAARLRVQANNDPATFQATYTAVRDAVLKTAPADAVPMLTELYNKRLAAGLAAVSGDQAAEHQKLQRQVYDEGVARQTSRVAILQGSDNPRDQLEAQDEHVKLSLLIDGGVNAGLYSKAEAQAMHIGAMRAITGQVFETQFDKTLANDGAVAAVGLLEKFQQAHISNLSNANEPPVLSEPEYQKLYAAGVTKLREYNLGIASLKRDGKTAEQLKFEEGDKFYTSQFLGGQLTDRALNAAVLTGDIKPERATALHSMMNNGADPAKSDPAALARLIHDPRALDLTGDEISGFPGVSRTDKLNFVRDQQRRRDNWEGTQAVKDAKGAISAALKILPGTPAAAMSDAQRRALTDATQEFIGLMNDVDPAKRDGAAASIARIVVQHAQQREAAADVVSYTTARQRYVQAHGPGSADVVDKDTFNARLKFYDDHIAQSRAAAKE